MIILGEDGMRSQYVPPKPTVKILKRPTRDSQGSGDGPLLNGDKPKQPIKSLKQVYMETKIYPCIGKVYLNIIQNYIEGARICRGKKKNFRRREKSRGKSNTRNK